MKRSFKIFLIIVSLIIIPANVFGESKNSDEIITGTYQYSAIEGGNKQNSNTFLYKDSDFTKLSFLGSKSLEVLSIQAAGASLSWYGNELDKYEIDTSQNDHNIKDLLNKMKFNDIESNKYYNLEKKENSERSRCLHNERRNNNNYTRDISGINIRNNICIHAN